MSRWFELIRAIHDNCNITYQHEFIRTSSRHSSQRQMLHGRVKFQQLLFPAYGGELRLNITPLYFRQYNSLRHEEGVADEKSLFGGIDVSRQIKKQRVALIIYEHSEDTF